jgi:hypothetical protein
MIYTMAITGNITRLKRLHFLFSLNFNNIHEQNNNSFLMNGLDESNDDDYNSSNFNINSNENLNHQPASIEILNGDELDMSTIGQEQSLDNIADFARLLANSQLSNDAQNRRRNETPVVNRIY